MVEENEVEVKKKGTNIKLKVFSVIFTIFFLIVLIIIKWKSKTFPLIYVLVLGGFILVGGSLAFFAGNIAKKFRERGEEVKKLTTLPKPVGLGELLAMAEQALTDKHFVNHTKGCDDYYFETLPKSRNKIFIYKTKALYTSEMKKGVVYIIINTHYPNDLRDVLIDPNEAELRRRIQTLGTEVEPEPIFEETITTTPSLGVQTVTKKPVVKKEKTEKEVEKEELE